MSLSSFSLSSTLSVAAADWTGEFAGVPVPGELVPEESPSDELPPSEPVPVVSSERLPPLMTMSVLSLSPLPSFELLLPCLT